jgi:type IV pilus assembly protein PilW
MHRFITENRGFTVVELMIALVVAAVVSVGAFAAYSVQSKTHGTQRQVARMQQDLRGALYMIEFDLMNAGRDPFMTGNYGLTDVRYYAYNRAANGYNMGALTTRMAPPANALPPFDSYPVLEFTSLRFDSDGDGISDTPITVRYQIYDFNNNDRPDLGRSIDGAMPPDLVAEGVVAIGYAFAYDDDRDGTYKLARVAPIAPAPLGNVIWAADTNGDNRLDTNLDTNGDGEITAADDINGDGVIDNGDLITAALPNPVELEAVRAVRIMILVQSERPSLENKGTEFNRRYAVGNRVFGPFNDNFQRRVQTVVVAMRNFKKL